jgi:hypothetical protein
MKVLTSLFLSVLCFSLLNGCSSDPLAPYHLEKRFWTPDDYTDVLSQIQYHTPEGEKLAGYLTPDRKAVFLKLVDVNNFKVVLDDTVLGIKHRSEFSKKMFDVYRDMYKIYSGLDNQDKYVYGSELADIIDFGLQLQISYFKLGNDKIVKEADNPKDPEILNLLRMNGQTIVGNFTLDLDEVNKESSFSAEALTKYANGIDANFKKLMEVFPSSDYSEMLEKAKLMLAKAKAPEVKASLTKLIDAIEAKKKAAAPVPVPES